MEAAIQVPCPRCAGEGGFYITHEMAIDGGDRAMEGQFWGCSECNGDGWILQEPCYDSPGTKGGLQDA